MNALCIIERRKSGIVFAISDFAIIAVFSNSGVADRD